MLSEVDAQEPLKLDEAFMEQLKACVGARSVNLQGEGNSAYVGDVSSPKIGDLRISYFQLKPDVSVIAQPTDGVLKSKSMSNGKRC